MPSVSTQVSPQDAPKTEADTGFDTTRRFWQILTKFDATKVSSSRALRNAIGVVLPLIGGFALGMPRGGLVMASGALNVSYSDGSDPYFARAKRMAASSVLCGVAVFAGAISGERQVAAVVFAMVWAFIVGMFVAIDGAASDIGVMSLVILLIYAAQPLTPKQAAAAGALALAGGLLQTSLSIALWPVRRYEPERRALANFYMELANRAATPLNATSAPLASVHSEQAQVALSGLTGQPGADSMRYRALLDQGERMRLSLLMLLRLRLRMERENQEYPGIEILNRYLELTSRMLRRIASSLSTPGARKAEQEETEQKDKPAAIEALDKISARMRQQSSATTPSFLAAVAKDAVFQMEAFSGQLRAALDLVYSHEEFHQRDATMQIARRGWKEVFGGWTDTLRANLNLQSSAYRHALRLAIVVAVGDILGRSISWRRTYWLPMTIALVLKPEFAATFSRGLLRIAGTITGLLLATALFHMMHPSAATQIALIFVYVYILRWLGPANYGIFGVVVSGLIVLLLAVAGIPPGEVIWTRGLTTAAGGVIALIAYVLWPTWERTRVSEQIARMLDAYREYIGLLSQLGSNRESSMQELEKARRAARAARANLLASAERLSLEPGTTSEQLSRLNTLQASSHRFIHAVMALDLIFLQDPAPAKSEAFRRFSSQLMRTLSLLSAALHGERVMAREFPDLREEHRLLVQSRTGAGDATLARFDSVNVETDRITNSVNTVTEQIMQWVRTPEFAKLHKLSLTTQPQEV